MLVDLLCKFKHFYIHAHLCLGRVSCLSLSHVHKKAPVIHDSPLIYGGSTSKNTANVTTQRAVVWAIMPVWLTGNVIFLATGCDTSAKNDPIKFLVLSAKNCCCSCNTPARGSNLCPPCDMKERRV